MTAVTVGGILALVDPLVLRFLIDKSIPSRSISLAAAALGLLLMAIAGRALATLVNVDLGFRCYQKITMRLRRALVNHQLRLSARYHERTPIGEKQLIFLKLIDDAAVLWSEVIVGILSNALLALLSFAALCYLIGWLAAGVLVVLPVYAVAVYGSRNRIINVTSAAADALTDLSARSHEVLSSVIPIQLLAMESRQRRYVERSLHSVYRTQKTRVKTEMRFMMATYAITSLGSLVLLALGTYAVFSGTITVGTLVAAYTYLWRVFSPAESLAEYSVRYRRLSASMDQLQGVFDECPVAEPPQAQFISRSFEPFIAMDNVWFRYDQGREWALRGLTLRLVGSGVIGIIGRNGAGKSSLAKLMVKLYPVDKGAICVCGMDIANTHSREIRHAVQYIGEQPALFTGTIAENIGLGRNFSSSPQTYVQEVLEHVGLSDFIYSLPNGTSTQIGPTGPALSWGQRQRLIIARALLMKPQVLILDEATSALDIEGESQVLKGIRKWLPTSLLVVITHRQSALKWCDRVVVLREGQVAEMGTPDDLSIRSEHYRSLLCISSQTEVSV